MPDAGNKSGRKRKKRRAVRRKQTAFQKYFQGIGGAAAFVLLIFTTILTGRSMAAGRSPASDLKPAQQEAEAAAAMTETGTGSAAGGEAVTAVAAAKEATPEPTVGPMALPIPENVPEQDVQGFFANGLAASDGMSVTILCGGDNLIHEAIYQKAANESGYDFNYLYDNVRSFIKSADIATINQEGPLASDLADVSGYPAFNTPKEAGQALYNAGFDVVNIGNNHIYDVGVDGALATEQYFQNRGIPVVGLYRNEADYQKIRIMECNGIKVAFLSFVEETNQDVHADEGFVVYMDERSKVKEQIKMARASADIVVVHAHWGEEGTTDLTDTQVEMANLMVEWGADIIYGNHPHVIQKLTTITRPEDSQICPVIYSMGNFVSAQVHRPQIVSAMLAVRVARDANGIARPMAMGVMPVITHFAKEDRMDIVLYPLAAYTDELAAAHRTNALDGPFSLEYIYDLLGASIPDRYLNRMSSLAE
ncbi:MAG: CapA family protein [Lachnospiraceae bacterium]|nr:CapA family protein [Lachnospiraceae bacterium]